MSLSVVYSRASVGIEAPQVVVETHLSNGLPRFTIVGLPETAVKESKDRVRSAIMQSGCKFPRKRITVNLAPADLPKEGGRFDLPIAISILLASRQLQCHKINQYEFAGELALGGALRPVKGIVPFALASQQANRQLIIPFENEEEATWVPLLKIYALSDLLSVRAHLSGKTLVPPSIFCPSPMEPSPDNVCLSEVCGQQQAKRALEVAAAGGHSLLMMGPPGTGKTMLASRFPTILPPISKSEGLEVAAIYSISQLGFNKRILFKRPFRQPHHTTSAVSLVGGGRQPLPGEVSLAHHGVLFLDELPEFSRQALEVLREPLESGKVHISRAAGQAEYPANCQLIAAMNPCPCGYLFDTRHQCQCSYEQILRYRNKISGPLLDRIDMHVEVPSIALSYLTSFHPKEEETSKDIQQRVMLAREIQQDRGRVNAKMTSSEIIQYCALDKNTQLFLATAIEKLGVSARAYHRILKIARTIADLNVSKDIQNAHVAQAIQYRKFDRSKIQTHMEK